MTSNELNYAAELITWMHQHGGFKCYIEKGTGRNLINRQERTVVLDFAAKDFLEQAELAKRIVGQLVIKEKLKAARRAQEVI